MKSGSGCLSTDMQEGLCQGVQKPRRDTRDQEQKDAQSTLSLLFLKGVISGPFEDELAVKQTKKKTTQRIVEVWGEEQGEGRSYVNVAVDSGVSSGPSGLPPGEHECGILVLIPLLENLGQTLLFTGSHFPYWSNKKLS